MKPGIVLTSLTRIVASSPTKKSTRAPPSQPSASKAREREVADPLADGCGQVRGYVELGGVAEVLRGEVVELLPAHDPDLRADAGLEGAFGVLEDPALDLAAEDALLDEHLGVVLPRRGDGGVEVGPVGHLADADARAGAGRLDEHRQPQRAPGLPEGTVGGVLGGAALRRHDDVRADRQAGADEQDLHDRLVHRRSGGEHSRADVRDPGQLEQPLQGAVLAVRTVQEREDDVDLAELAGRLAGLADDQGRELGSPASTTETPAPSTSGSSAPRISSVAGSSGASTHRPSRVMPTGTTSQASRSIARSTLPALTQEMACSELRPPNTTATRGLRRSAITPTDPILSPVDLSPATLVVTTGRPSPEPGGPVNAPLVLSSTYHAGTDVGYGRDGNPVWSAFEEALGALEGGQALAFASGVAAISAILDALPQGSVVVAPAVAYSGTVNQLRELAANGRLELRSYDASDSDDVIALLPGADLLWLESATNPTMDVADIPLLSAAAHTVGATVVVDATFATPLVQRPLELGADVVVHSATKYLAGHSDVLLGVVVTQDEAWLRRLARLRHDRGGIAGPFETWLALRGLRTLALRMERAQANALELAQRLSAHPAVAEGPLSRPARSPGARRGQPGLARLRGDHQHRRGR